MAEGDRRVRLAAVAVDSLLYLFRDDDNATKAKIGGLGIASSFQGCHTPLRVKLGLCWASLDGRLVTIPPLEHSEANPE